MADGYVLKEVSEKEHERVNEKLNHHERWLGEHERKGIIWPLAFCSIFTSKHIDLLLHNSSNLPQPALDPTRISLNCIEHMLFIWQWYNFIKVICMIDKILRDSLDRNWTIIIVYHQVSSFTEFNLS